jgi:alkanesulfonate monooxygenase SsuD/methylene tetrahydromethanopterin reductase-like flavin-dependent oxidoreductase (luciferase family)
VIRFCAYQYQHLPFPTLVERWRRSEAAGFDVLWNVDAVNEPDYPGRIMFEAATTLAAMAATTSRIRVGTLVTSLYVRNPVIAAKAAMTVDHLSGGRLEVALGAGDPSVKPEAAGVSGWSPGDQVARFDEFVELFDRLLRNETTTFKGRYYRCTNAEMLPGPLQRPRPPITIAAHGPKMLRIAAGRADAWSQWGGYGIETEPDLFKTTRDRCAHFDDICAGLGRDPTTIRRSLVCFPPLTPWESVGYFADMVDRYHGVGIDEFVLYWPQTWRAAPYEDSVFDLVCGDLLPTLRNRQPGRTARPSVILPVRPLSRLTSEYVRICR